MMRTYKINFDGLRQTPNISEMLLALERGFSRFDIDYYLIGAVARDAWLTGIYGLEPETVTRDIDFAVLIHDHATYSDLKQYLIAHEGFRESKGNAFILFYKDKTQVDLLPFGDIEDADGNVTTEGVGLTSISLDGFREVYDAGLPDLDLEGKHLFKFCSLPGYMLLKLIAWDDRPDQRQKDVRDIAYLLRHFYNVYEEIIWENHNDLFEEPYPPHTHLAARVMGRELRKIASRRQTLYDRILNILGRNTESPETSNLAELMIDLETDTVEEMMEILKQIKTGFTE